MPDITIAIPISCSRWVMALPTAQEVLPLHFRQIVPPLERGSSTVSLVPGVEGAVPPARPSSSMHSCTSLQYGVHLKAPPANSTVLRRNLSTFMSAAVWLNYLTDDVVWKLFSMAWFGESKLCWDPDCNEVVAVYCDDVASRCGMNVLGTASTVVSTHQV